MIVLFYPQTIFKCIKKKGIKDERNKRDARNF